MACEKNEKKSQVIDIALFSCALFCLHLLRFMIESIYKMIKEQQIMYTYSEELFSDFHKDAYGFRPRHHRFYDADTTPAEKQEIWDATGRAFDRRQEEEAQMERKDLAEFKSQITAVIAAGAGNRITALRWMTSTETFYNRQCVEHWVWEQGILFTDYGRELVEELMEIVTFEEFE